MFIRWTAARVAGPMTTLVTSPALCFAGGQQRPGHLDVLPLVVPVDEEEEQGPPQSCGVITEGAGLGELHGPVHDLLGVRSRPIRAR